MDVGVKLVKKKDIEALIEKNPDLANVAKTLVLIFPPCNETTRVLYFL